jgi:F-type H+-transporting ATPase subunit delta
MKVRKESLRAARLLLKGVMPGGKIDAGKVKDYTARIIAEKPRNFVQILEKFQHLLRLEVEKRHAMIESADKLDEPTQKQVLADLHSRFGSDLTHEFKVTPELMGGLRIKLGSSIWDGSLRTRLETLRQAMGV